MSSPDASGPKLTRRDEALLEACAWLEKHPENYDGADRTRVIRWIRGIEARFGRLRWPASAEVPRPYTGELP